MERMLREAHWGYISLPAKAGVVCEKGKLACFDTAANGLIVRGAARTGLIGVGVFHETKVAASPDGATKIHIKMFREIQAIWWDNDAAAPFDAADVGTIAYIKDDVTVTATATGSPLGLILAVDPSKGVLVYSPLPHLPA
jgi:hypothetical protein